MTKPAGAAGPGAIWTPSFEHSHGLKISLVSSNAVSATVMRACFVLSNTNSPPGGSLGSGGAPAGADISATDANGSGLPFKLSSPVAIDVGAMDVSCTITGGGSGMHMTPIAPVAMPGLIPAAHATNKCCVTIAAPPAAAPAAPLALFAAGAPACNVSYPECVPGTGDEILYELQTTTEEDSTEAVYIWTLSAPGCGLVGLEPLLALSLARCVARCRTRRARRAAA